MKKGLSGQEFDFEDLYLDANVFIYAVLDNGSVGENARKIIENVRRGVYSAYTSTLTLDEILWKVQKVIGKEKAAEIAGDFLNLANLEFVSVDKFVLAEMLIFYVNEKLAPRDAIHTACMKVKKLRNIASSDADFDKIKGIKRIDFSK